MRAETLGFYLIPIPGSHIWGEVAQIHSSLSPVSLFSDDKRKETKFLLEDPEHSGRSRRRRRKGRRRMRGGGGGCRRDEEEEEEEMERRMLWFFSKGQPRRLLPTGLWRANCYILGYGQGSRRQGRHSMVLIGFYFMSKMLRRFCLIRPQSILEIFLFFLSPGAKYLPFSLFKICMKVSSQGICSGTCFQGYIWPQAASESLAISQ